LCEVKSISLYGCAAQVCFFVTFSVWSFPALYNGLW
jgi:hypothetical protein